MLLVTLLLFTVGGINILIGLLVLLRDYRKLQNLLFFLFSLSLGGWVIGIGGFLMSQSPSIAFIWAKIYYSFPLIVALTMPFFARTFPSNVKMPRILAAIVVLGYLLIAAPLVIVPDFLTVDLAYHAWGKEIILDKSAYLAYSVFLLSCLAGGLLHIYNKSKTLRGLAKRQAQFFFAGFILTSIFGVYFNLILPWFGNYRLIWLGPLFTNAFIIATGYSLIKHRMFDMRLVVARSFGYIMSLITLASIYGFLVFGVARFIFDVQFSVTFQIYLSAATGIIALSFSWFKRFYDRATKRLFYRDAYDPQAFFDELNKVLVSTIDIDLLLREVAKIIAAHLNVQFCIIGVRGEGNVGRHIVGTVNKHLSEADIRKVRHLTSPIHRTVLATDDLTSEDELLRQILIKNDVALLAQLRDDITVTKESLGFITLGNKRGGTLFNAQDSKVMEAVANELTIAIQNALRFEEIQEFNITLRQRIDEATRKLRHTNEKLRQLDQTKDDFISMASHQLRTPLTSVKGYVSMVLEGDAGKVTPLQRKLLNQSFVSAQRMVYLISDLLNVSRLRTGKFVIESIPCNLAKIIKDEIEQLQETAKGRGLALTYNMPEKFPTLMLDETKIRQVIMNFIDNAIYYTPTGGHISVSLLDKAESVEFTVTDDGIGVPKHEQHHLFSKFFRAHNAKRARPDGTGLGLFMAKKVVVAQGGAIIFKSKEGHGSIFGFSFAKEKIQVAELSDAE
jgi:signal transduction histidine kinase